MKANAGPANDGTPNGKPYMLVHTDDGSQYVHRSPGREPQRLFDLRGAIAWADHMTSHGEPLAVTDPDTGTVLWTGELLTR